MDFVSSKNATQKISAGLIITSPWASSGFLERVQTRVLAERRNAFVTLRPSDAPNLKSLLKNLIRRATNSAVTGENDDDEQDAVSGTTTSGPKLLNYDLQILCDWCKTKRIDKVIIALRDCETFDVNVFSDFISVLQYGFSLMRL